MFINEDPNKLDSFAQCLAYKGATLYGAFWCPECQAQKQMFRDSAKFLPYAECSTPDGYGQLQICKDKEIREHPTWELTDGSRLEGRVLMKQLEEKTGCFLP